MENGGTISHLGLDGAGSTANERCDSLIEDSMDGSLANNLNFMERWSWSHWIVHCCCSNILSDEPMKVEWCWKRKKKMRKYYEKVSVVMEEVEDSEPITLSNSRESVDEEKEEVSFVFLLENPPAVRLLKFFFITLIYILLTYYSVRWMVRFLKLL
jgi:hypothetical protein